MPLIILLMIWLTTVRHETAHWITALAQGVEIREVRLFPGIHPELGFYFGYVARGDGGTWMIDAAPFLAAMLWLFAAWLILRRLRRDSKFWSPLFLIGGVSPLIDLAYNYQGGFWRTGSDVHDLFQMLPDVLVHAFFLLSMAVCLVALRNMRSIPIGSSSRPE
jgi:hypothetical protein